VAHPSEHDTRVWIRRPRLDPWAAGAGLVILIVSMVLVSEPPASWEESAFRALNDLPHQVEPALWVLQQAGSAVIIPIAAVVMWFKMRHWRPSVGLVLGGFFLGWLAAKGVKAIVGRGRPGDLLDDVALGFDVPVDGIGFPSGHAVLAFTLATVLAPYLSRRMTWAFYSLAVVVALARIYVGAHMPLDVIGGAAYGVVVGSVVNLAVGIKADEQAS
jgi:undecaprenyl-diphosphatase